jgi:hypothetical protein
MHCPDLHCRLWTQPTAVRCVCSIHDRMADLWKGVHIAFILIMGQTSLLTIKWLQWRYVCNVQGAMCPCELGSIASACLHVYIPLEDIFVTVW